MNGLPAELTVRALGSEDAPAAARVTGYTEKHDLHDVLKPDYFRNVAADFGMRHGDVMDCIVGDPVEGLHLRLVVDWKQRLEPICVAIVWKHRATPCRHDGAIEEAA